MEEELHIRRFRAEDLEAILEITVLGFEPVCIDGSMERRFGPIAGTDWRSRKCRQIHEDVAADPDGILVCEVEGQVAGYITSNMNRDSGMGRIPNLATHPDHRRKGIARVLIAAVLDRFRREGMEVARIETLEQNEAGRALYPSFGFEEVARQIHFAARLQDRDIAKEASAS
jgi:ribosomal protein S18 acetylase RimI-like enzyme